MSSTSQLDPITLDADGLPSPVSNVNDLAGICMRMQDGIDRILDYEEKSLELLTVVKSELSNSAREAIGSKGSADEDQSSSLGMKRIVVLIDGDGAIFDLKLVADGKKGGREAALMLATGVTQHLQNQEQEGIRLFAYVFLQKQGLENAFRRSSNALAAKKLGDFMAGFNQAEHRFIMVDSGDDNEATDAKLKAFMEAEICLPQTKKIVIAGTHDGGYITTLRSHITLGYKHKLILLKSYDEDLAKFADLDLPTIRIKNLFIPEKLITTATPQVILKDVSSSQTPAVSPKSSPAVRRGHGRGTSLGGTPNTVPLEVLPASAGLQRRPISHPGTPELNTLAGFGSLHPKPCHAHYLLGSCTFDNECKFRHDSSLTEAQVGLLRDKVKRYFPCPSIKKGGTCRHGDDCIYSHGKCPYLPNCRRYFRDNSCDFGGEDMHTPDEQPEPGANALGLEGISPANDMEVNSAN